MARVAVFIPFHSIRGGVSINRAGFSCNFLTVGSSPVWWTPTAISIDLIHTGGAKGTRRRLALINIDPTVWTSEAWGALAAVPVIPIDTGSAVVAWVGTAVVGILRACGTLPAFLADTGKRLPSHHAGTSILTWVWKTTRVFGDVTRCTLPPGGTLALERVAFVMAGATVVACGFIALTFAGVARLSLPAILAFTEEISHQVSTCPSIMTGVGAAVIDVDLAVVALPTVAADALVHTDFVDAGASIAAWVTLAVVDVLVAVSASEALLALAAELAPGLAPAAAVRSTHI